SRTHGNSGGHDGQGCAITSRPPPAAKSGATEPVIFHGEPRQDAEPTAQAGNPVVPHDERRAGGMSEGEEVAGGIERRHPGPMANRVARERDGERAVTIDGTRTNLDGSRKGVAFCFKLWHPHRGGPSSLSDHLRE